MPEDPHRAMLRPQTKLSSALETGQSPLKDSCLEHYHPILLSLLRIFHVLLFSENLSLESGR